MNGSYGPWLVAAGGPRSGERYALRVGDQVIGRAETADVIVGAGDVSREHAHVWWDGTTATITDAGSSHGTEVNGYRLVGSQALRPGDVLRLGSAELRFETPDAERATGRLRLAASEDAASGLSNGVGRDNYGEIVQAGRDVNYDYDVDIRNRFELDDPMDELFKGRGVGRSLMAIGLLIALAGFGGWMYLILSGGASLADGHHPVDAFSVELFGVPAAMVAFGSFLVGGVIASVGKGMSKAARERAERIQETRRRRGFAYR